MKKILLIATILVLSLAGKAQTNYFGLTYNMAVPMGETKDFIDRYSWGVMGLEWKYMVSDKFGAGVNFSWQVMSQKITKGTIEVDNNTSITGTQLRYLNYFPMTATGTYFFNPDSPVIVHAGGGLGLYRVLQRFDISGFVFEQNTWNFGFYPEIGFIVPTGGNVNFWVNSKYHYIVANSGKPSHSFLNINVGFSYFY